MHPILKALYAELPHVMCKGLCYTTCGPVPVTKLEREEIAQLTGRRVKTETAFDVDTTVPNPLMLLRSKNDLTCVYLQQHRCSIYAARPIVCRMYGVSQGLPCTFGCVPDRLISDAEGQALLDRLRVAK